MAVPEYIRKRFNGRVPDYIVRFYAQRAEWQRRQDAAIVEAKRKKERERERIRSLRKPPAKVWRVGRTIFWEPSDTVGEHPPAGYWVSEQRNGEWTAHGDYLLPHFRCAQLFGDGPARVEAYYNDSALGEVYYSPVVHAPEGETGRNGFLVSRVQYYVSEHGRPSIYYQRWRRVLAGFGVANGKTVRGKMIIPANPPMTAAEAQSYADLGWGRWVPVAKALRRIERIRNVR